MSEAMSQIDRARELDPLSPIIPTAKGRLLHFHRKYDEAIEHHRKALPIETDFVGAHLNLGMVYEQMAMFAEAIAEFRRVIRIAGRAPFWLAGLGHAYGVAGRKGKAGEILREFQLLRSKRSNVSSFDVAWVKLGLNEIDATFGMDGTSIRGALLSAGLPENRTRFRHSSSGSALSRSPPAHWTLIWVETAAPRSKHIGPWKLKIPGTGVLSVMALVSPLPLTDERSVRLPLLNRFDYESPLAQSVA